jgi:hypothetical protein
VRSALECRYLTINVFTGRIFFGKIRLAVLLERERVESRSRIPKILHPVARPRYDDFDETSSSVSGETLPHLRRTTARRVTLYDVIGDQAFCTRPILGYDARPSGFLIKLLLAL